MQTVLAVTVALAALPCSLFLVNLFFFRPLPRGGREPGLERQRISVLIPARNEEQNIRSTLEAVLLNRRADFEVVVLDDHSTDGTAAIVNEFVQRDPRVRLETAPALPSGWCGKQHACATLAKLANGQLLLFLDADVRLADDALPRLALFMGRTQAALASGAPRQELGTFTERLLLPLIHFVLLGYLPMPLMRWTKRPAFSAGCGQLFIIRADAYHAVGGHTRIPATLHDGIKLPRVFREAGYQTELFDATDLAVCRMYRSNVETWNGLAKNATEGLGAPGVILPMTTLLVGDGVLPLAVLMWTPTEPLAILAAILAYTPRFIAMKLFRQPFLSALLHPLGVIVLLAIQWLARLRLLRGRPSEWKGRRYPQADDNGGRRILGRCSFLLLAGAIAASGAGKPPEKLGCIELSDQYDRLHQLCFPGTSVSVLLIADRKAAADVDAWLAPLKERFSGRIVIRGLAQVAGVPAALRPRVRRRFQQLRDYPVLMDWTGEVCSQLAYDPGELHLLVLNTNGFVLERLIGPASGDKLRRVFARIDTLLAPAARRAP